MTHSSVGEFQDKMRAAGMSGAALAAFAHNYGKLVSGDTGLIPEAGIQPVTELPRFVDIARETQADPALLSQTVVVKLNGGLGTSMGLEKAKSLLKVKDGLAFLDFIVRQILHLRAQHRVALRFVLMNSFSTSRDTLDYLTAHYPDIGSPASLELMQSQVPKVDAATLRPVNWPENPQLEWCPPGHGDFYTALFGSGLLDSLLKQGVKYAFISNSDNLGASLDLALLTYFARSGQGFMMEAAQRTASDRKGGHLALRNGKFLLRESAQCPKSDTEAFQDVGKHRFFNTNNLWVRLDLLKPLLDANGGFLPLPLIKNSKTVDPRRKDSTPVYQLETAMGSAIECFSNAGAVLVPRTRFAPVKTTSDLLALRSDAYQITEDWRIELAGCQRGEPPTIDLDPDYYKLVDAMDALIKGGVPSLSQCRKLVIRGPVVLSSGNIFAGKATVTNASKTPKALAPGTYRDCSQELK